MPSPEFHLQLLAHISKEISKSITGELRQFQHIPPITVLTPQGVRMLQIFESTLLFQFWLFFDLPQTFFFHTTLLSVIDLYRRVPFNEALFVLVWHKGGTATH
jgi:hypothetical protein